MRELEAVRLHGVARPIVVVAHIAVVKVGHALLARAVRHRGVGGSINAASVTTSQFDQLLGSTGGAVRRGRCFGGRKCEERDGTAGGRGEEEEERGEDGSSVRSGWRERRKAWVMGQERTFVRIVKATPEHGMRTASMRVDRSMRTDVDIGDPAYAARF